MKAVCIFIMISGITFANSINARGAGGGSGTLSPELQRTKDELLGAGGGSGTLRVTEIFDDSELRRYNLLKDVGEFKFDSISDRWLLKTKSRILSISDIDLVEDYEQKQNEVDYKAFELKSRRRTIPSKFMKRYLEKNIKFNEYILDDFEY